MVRAGRGRPISRVSWNGRPAIERAGGVRRPAAGPRRCRLSGGRRPPARPRGAGRAARRAGVRLGFVTNNASRTPPRSPSICSGWASTARPRTSRPAPRSVRTCWRSACAPGSTVLAVGGPGVAAALIERGFVPVHGGRTGSAGSAPAPDWAPRWPGSCRAIGPDVSWRDLAAAAFAVQSGASLGRHQHRPDDPAGRGDRPGQRDPGGRRDRGDRGHAAVGGQAGARR